MLKAQITFTEAGEIYQHKTPVSINLCNATLFYIHKEKSRDQFKGGYYKTDVILTGKYKGEDFSYQARIDVTEEEFTTIYLHISSYFRYLWKNRHDKRNPVAYYRPLLQGQIIALKLLKQTA
jgi:hypothetical protein